MIAVGAFLTLSVAGLYSEAPARAEINYIQEMRNRSEVGNQLKEIIFSAKSNLCCKPDDSFCPSQCHYPTNLSYDYFEGKSPWSLIPSGVFSNEAKLNQWATDQNKNTYLIAYKKGCPGCANLLAAVETRAQDLRSSNINLYKINVEDNQSALGANCWNYDGTPTVWKIKQGSVQEVAFDKKARNFYHEFIHLRAENKVPENFLQYARAIIAIQAKQKWNYGFGYFKHDAKLLTTCVAAGLLYGGYKLYKKLQDQQKKAA